MNRKQFIESCGATCDNWTWAWSFINTKKKFVIFGAWDIYDEGNKTLILAEDWRKSPKGRNQPGYAAAIKHLGLVEKEGYLLRTFSMKHMSNDPADESAPARIKGFTPKLVNRALLRIGGAWYACDPTPSTRLSEELDPIEIIHREGAGRTVIVNGFERNAEARTACLKHHGLKCIVCAFDFEQTYGPLGIGYIHVHHVVPLSEIRSEYIVNPVRDLVPICPNCHAMVHSTHPSLTIAQLREALSCQKNANK